MDTIQVDEIKAGELAIKHVIRGFDAIHLASARISGETEVVATDSRLRDAAKLLGLSVFPT